MPPQGTWPALRAARAHDASRRLPWHVGDRLAGSVSREHLAALSPWPRWLDLRADAVRLTASDPTAALADINVALRAQGLVRGWRDELFPVFDLDAGSVLARMERAACRFWGALTLGAHANGYVAGTDGRPTHLWIAQRSATKATDPGLHDNLVGGGVPAGQTPWQALQREGWEEAGLPPDVMARATPGSVLRLQRDIAEGLQLEDLHAYDLALPAGLRPENQDGEVQGFQCLPVQDALALASGTAMTVDAALVTLDFALRHGLLSAAADAALQEALFACAVGRAQTT